jgi:predicted acetyltransferase
MTTEVRVLDPAEWDGWYATLQRAFGGVAEDPEEHALWHDLTEYDRSLGVWDGAECVGTAGAFSFRIAVPGGAVVPAAGVTMVSVAATHRRRGLLTAMMRRQLDDVRTRGEALAVLTASEPAIYGRFGYGIGACALRLDIDTTRVRMAVPEGADGVRLRFVRPVEAADVCEAVYARLVPRRPGLLARRPGSGWRRVVLLDTPGERQGGSPLQCVLAERAGEVAGYARFHIKPMWDASGPRGAILLRDVEALDPAAYGALWRFLGSVDLTSSLVAPSRPVDEPALHLVSDLRRCRAHVRDTLHVRLVEVGAALEARTYRAPLDVVFEVADTFCPWNAGRWRLTAEPGMSAFCERTGDAAELALSVRELGAAYLGGCTLTSLAGAGQVRELRRGALAEASLAFGSDVAPWSPHVF